MKHERVIINSEVDEATCTVFQSSILVLWGKPRKKFSQLLCFS